VEVSDPIVGKDTGSVRVDLPLRGGDRVDFCSSLLTPPRVAEAEFFFCGVAEAEFFAAARVCFSLTLCSSSLEELDELSSVFSFDILPGGKGLGGKGLA
jgi:hypothetical protein